MILIVDDDPRILAMVKSALIDGGYDVITCDNGAAACAALKAEPGVKLLLTDVLMPGMRGTELAQQAKAMRPDLPIMFMSGDIGDTDPAAFAGHPLLTKPFTATALHQAVAACLA